MLMRIGTTFPPSWQYGPEEIEMVDNTSRQIEARFPNERNLLINTTWFGPQYKDVNDEWLKIEKLFVFFNPIGIQELICLKMNLHLHLRIVMKLFFVLYIRQEKK